MRIVVVGGSGLIGNKVMTALHDAGHHAVAASPAFGIDAYTGEGLDEAMAGADVVVDVSNAPSWGDQKVLEFFTTVTRNAFESQSPGRCAAQCRALGPRLRPLARERLHGRQGRPGAANRESRVPFTIVHSTQFMEFLARVADASTEAGVVRTPDTRIQPIAGVEVARLVAAVATAPPPHGDLEIAGPEVVAFEDAIARVLAARGDGRRVVADPAARYFGAVVRDGVLLPGARARLADLRPADWLSRRGDRAAAA
jgi:uncharacterized protein YbjT (DUF2867 family)